MGWLRCVRVIVAGMELCGASFSLQWVYGQALPPAPAATTTAALAKLVAAGRDDAALEEIRTMRSSGAGTPGLDRVEGDALYDLNRLPEASAAFARALTADPQDQESAQMRGLTLVKLGRPAEAIPLLEASHAQGAQSKADPTYVLALCYMDTRRYDDARRAFAAQYGFAPDSAPAYLVAARMLLRREYTPVAQQFGEKALALDPKLPLAHELLGEIALAGGHTEAAVQQLEAEKASNPLEGIVYERLGDAYSREAHYPEAERVLQQAVLLEPNATGPYILLGKVLLKQGQPVGAMSFLQRAVAMDPSSYMSHNLLSQAYRATGRMADASRELALTEKIQAADEPKLAAPK